MEMTLHTVELISVPLKQRLDPSAYGGWLVRVQRSVLRGLYQSRNNVIPASWYLAHKAATLSMTLIGPSCL